MRQFLFFLILLSSSVLYALPHGELMLDDFENGNLWSPITTLGWWHLDDSDVYRYQVDQTQTLDGAYSMKIEYHKNAPYQLIGGFIDSINTKSDFSNYDAIRLNVYGAVKILLKLEDRWSRQSNVGIKTSLRADQWNELVFDYSTAPLDLANIKNIFLFIAPNDDTAQGTIYLDSIALVRNRNNNIMAELLSSSAEEKGKEDPSQVKDTQIRLIASVDSAVDQDGHIYLLQEMASMIFKYNSSGRYLAEYARRGKMRGQLMDPSRMVLDETGENLYLLDYGSNRIQKFARQGYLNSNFANQGILDQDGEGNSFGQVQDIAVDENGFLYILDGKTNAIWRFNSQGTEGTLIWGRPDQNNFILEAIRLKIFDANLYVLDASSASVDQFTLTGDYVSSAKCVNDKGEYFIPQDCAFDPDSKTCFMLSQNQKGIVVFDRDWNYVGTSVIDHLVKPEFIDISVVNGRTKVIIGDQGRGQVTVMSLRHMRDLIQ